MLSIRLSASAGLALSLTLTAVVLGQAEPTSQPASTQPAAPDGLDAAQAIDADDEYAVDVKNIPAQVLAKGDPLLNSGGRRGEGDPDLVLAAVAPIDVARTRLQRPALYYHLSKPTSKRIVIAVSKEGSPDREGLLEFTGADRGGFYKLDLASMNVTLDPGTVYEWVVAIVEDETYRSKDLVVTGFIQRMDLSADQKAAIEATTTFEQRSRALKEAGLTQDALSMLVGVDRRLAGEATGAEFHRDLLRALQLTETSPAETRSRPQ